MTETTPATDASQPTSADGTRSRRQLLTLAGAAAVGGTALALGHASPAGAANGDPITAGETTGASIDTILTSTAAAVAALQVRGTSDGVAAIAAQGQGDASDLKLLGTGRLAQTAATTGNTQPSFGINNLSLGSTDQGHEIVRSNSGVIWASTGTGTGGSTAWKRMNTPRFDNPSGNGAPFTPFRLLDTRSGQSSAITRNSPLSTNTNFDMDVDNLAQIPSGAIGVFGNITVLASNYTGFVKLYPAGTSEPTVASINFGTGALVGNFFQVGLSSGGGLRVRPGEVAGRTVHVIIDIFGYIQ